MLLGKFMRAPVVMMAIIWYTTYSAHEIIGGTMSKGIELADLVDYVASQLAEAEGRASKRASRIIALQECQLEMTVTVKREGKAGIRVYVVELGGGGSSEHLHRISAKFRPVGEHIFDTAEDSESSASEYHGKRVVSDSTNGG